MSGGYLDYAEFRINEAADKIDRLIRTNKLTRPDGFGDTFSRDYNEETIREFKGALRLLRYAAVYAQRIDYLVSSDDSENSFHERLKKDLNEVDQHMESAALEWERESRLIEFLSDMYLHGTGIEAGKDRCNRVLISKFVDFLPENTTDEVDAFLKEKPWVFEKIKARVGGAKTEINIYGDKVKRTHLYHEPVILLVYYAADKFPSQARRNWTESMKPSILDEVFSDLGIAADAF